MSVMDRFIASKFSKISLFFCAIASLSVSIGTEALQPGDIDPIILVHGINALLSG